MAGDKRSFLSKEDLTGKISKTVFVTNFPDHLTDGIFGIFQRESMASFVQPSKVKMNTGPVKKCFTSVMKSNDHKGSPLFDSSPAIVMDDSFIVDKDLSCSLMGKIKDINALSNIYVIFDDEGFDNVNISYYGGFWILIEALKTDLCGSLLKGFLLTLGIIMNMRKLSPSEEAPKTGTVSKDPFGIYSILKRNDQKEKSNDAEKSNPSFPPGFTPKGVNEITDEEANVSVNKSNSNHHCNKKTGSNGKCESNRPFKLKAGGSILVVMEDLIEIGHAMGYNMKGCSKNIKAIVDHQGVASAVRGMWISSSLKLMFVLVYAHQDITKRRSLWDYINHMINLWDGECIILRDFNEVRSENEIFGSNFNEIGAKAFNHFISSSCLIDLPLEGYSFTWPIKSASKMRKLDRFLISEGLISIFPSLAAICLDRRLSDHRPILLRESTIDYSRDEMHKASAMRHSGQSRISELDKLIDKGLSNNNIINERISLLKDIHDLDKRHSFDLAQKAKIQWAIEGDENSKYFHGIINKNGLNLLFVVFLSMESGLKILPKGWIQACLSLEMGSILVNGSPSSEFKFHKGLKQGDALSPFLFILVMESLHISLNNILNSGLDKGIRIDESLTLSHLFYADDAVFIGKWDKANVITIVNMLKCFYLVSGLKINIQNSKIMGIGTSQEEVDTDANVIGCNTFSLPFNYLGVKVGSSSSRSNFWDEVIAKLSFRLSKWKIKTLSIGGRFTLNKAFLSSLPIYLMSIDKTCVGVLRKIESIRRRFFNGADTNENKIVVPKRWVYYLR
nr:RNA-directed DNA polymerase, eukaryota [Tanacetum cinerariifolium]